MGSEPKEYAVLINNRLIYYAEPDEYYSSKITKDDLTEVAEEIRSALRNLILML